MRLFFHLLDSHETIQDTEGVDVADARQARTEALRVIAELRQEDPSAPREWSGWILRVTDASGRIVLSLDLDAGIH